MEAFTVEVDATNALLVLRKGAQRQRFAIANALNETGKLIQSTVRESVFRRFTVRQRLFLLRQAALIPRMASAPQNRLEVEVKVGQRPRLLLGMFEAGGTRFPFKGKNVAIPAIGGARPSQSSPVQADLYVQRLGLHLRRGASHKAGAGPAIVGRLDTYIVPGKGIYQHVPGRREGRLLYAFKPTTRIDSRLGFVDTARGIALVFAPEFLADQVRKTFEHNFADTIAGLVADVA